MNTYFPHTLDGWLQYIEALHPKSIVMGLERTRTLIQRLNLYPKVPVIMIAGTNGKGSTTAFIEHIYHASGYKTGCYTSPHLIRYNERVRLNCLDADDKSLCDAFAAIEAVRGDTTLTYFEFGTLAAVWLFMREAVDVIILEVGLGGRLDSVNAFEPDCAIVTSIDLDHTEYLGGTREEIGFEKAGIFRKQIPAICGDTDPPQRLLQYAHDVNATLMCIGKDFGYSRTNSGFIYHEDGQEIDSLPKPVLEGDFQFSNASCAIRAVRTLKHRLPIKFDSIRESMRTTRLLGRFQIIRQKPWVILDVAHNPHAAAALANNLRSQPCAGRTLAVFGMLADKDIGGVMSIMQDMIDIWYLADIQHARGATASQLKQDLLSKINKPAHTFSDAWGAYQSACKDAGENDRIVVFGSFFTVAMVMDKLNNH